MTVAAATLLIAKAHWRMFRNRARHSLSENRLLTFTVSSFLGVYSVAAYILVSKGLDFVQALPLLGPLLTERLIYLLFFFFLIMLILSNATITGMSLFRRRDTEWQVSLPLPPRSLVLWKTIEGMFLASWGLLVLSAPILLALGQLFKAGPSFYLTGAAGLVCLVTLAANASTWFLLAIVRWARPWWWKPAAAALGTLVIIALYRFWSTNPEQATAGDMVANLNEVLKHTELCMHPMLPSVWVTEGLTAAGRGLTSRALFYNLVLLAYALVSFLITAAVGSAWFPGAWQRIMTHSESETSRDRQRLWYRHRTRTAPLSAFWKRLFALDRPAASLMLKDIRTFIREPVQWGQCAMVFGLLFFYASNLRRLGYDLQNPFWINLISYLNLVVCALALSTLTTRFIFPQFSQEGQRMWILGLSPVPLHRLLSLKLRLSASIIALLTTALVVISSTSLNLPIQRTLFFSAAIILLSYGLTALALAIGALIPNFREPNPARIVSGFGGTLCLISSFIYILLSITVLVLPTWWRLRTGTMPPSNIAPTPLPDLLALGGVFCLTLIFGAIPFAVAKKQTKKLEYLRVL
jgi:ABC-2 type transport system permease protein